MKCIKCGVEISDNCKFCPECGASQEISSRFNTYRMKCLNCGGILELEQNRAVLSCPYCGTKELIPENDTVRIERIKANTYRDIELEKINLERETRISSEKDRAASDFKNGRLSKLFVGLIVYFVLCILEALYEGRILAAFIAIVQTALSLLGWMMGARVIPEKIPGLHIMLAILSIILVYPFMKAVNYY